MTGQFASADTVADGLNCYGYVKGNPKTATDPTMNNESFKIVDDYTYYCHYRLDWGSPMETFVVVTNPAGRIITAYFAD